MIKPAEAVFFKHWSEVPSAIWRWPDFAPQEIACKGDGSIRIHFDALDKLQKARDIAGKPFHINSAYRSLDYNTRVGGRKNSMHLQGRAFDISLKNFEKKELHEILMQAGFTGFGLNYKSFVHADNGKKRQW